MIILLVHCPRALRDCTIQGCTLLDYGKKPHRHNGASTSPADMVALSFILEKIKENNTDEAY